MRSNAHACALAPFASAKSDLHSIANKNTAYLHIRRFSLYSSPIFLFVAFASCIPLLGTYKIFRLLSSNKFPTIQNRCDWFQDKRLDILLRLHFTQTHRLTQENLLLALSISEEKESYQFTFDRESK